MATQVRAPMHPEVPARHLTLVRKPTQKPPHPEIRLASFCCPAKDSPWDPWAPNFGFPKAGFSYMREGQPQAIFSPVQGPRPGPREREHQHHSHHLSNLIIKITFRSCWKALSSGRFLSCRHRWRQLGKLNW